MVWENRYNETLKFWKHKIGSEKISKWQKNVLIKKYYPKLETNFNKFKHTFLN